MGDGLVWLLFCKMPTSKNSLLNKGKDTSQSHRRVGSSRPTAAPSRGAARRWPAWAARGACADPAARGAVCAHYLFPESLCVAPERPARSETAAARRCGVKMAAAAVAAAAAAAAAASLQVLEMESMETAAAGSAGLAAELRGSGTVEFGSGPCLSAMEAGGGDPGPEAEDFECSSHCSELSWRQNEQRRQGLFCDITLCFGGAGGREFRAHRSVLAAATEYFTPLLSGQFSESRSGRVEMRKWSSEPGPEPDTVEAVIEYMYTGRIRVSTGSVHEVLELADR